MEVIDGRGVASLLGSGASVALVWGGDRAAFRHRHIPGSIVFPDVDSAVRVLAGQALIVVYGADARCRGSARLGDALRAGGSSAVRWYAGGLADWVAAGGTIDGDGAQEPGD